MDFTAVDVETANADLATICQLGIVEFAGGKEVASWQSLVDPQDDFDFWNEQIHGITTETVAGSLTWPEVYGEVFALLHDRVVVCHTSFDRFAIQKACERHGLPEIPCTWLDTAKVVRRTWPQFSQRGYSLANVAEFLGVQFKNHYALEDARVAGLILVQAVAQSGVAIADWLKRVHMPISGTRQHYAQSGNVDGALFGEKLTFTGKLDMPRAEAARRASDAGCTVCESVTAETTLLVVGAQDVRKLAGHEKSSKHRKAERLQAQGHGLRIISESDFLEITRLG